MKKTSIGGEAIIEGVMMRGPESVAIAVRKADGEVVVDKKPYRPATKRYRFLKVPIIRGAVSMIESMVLGVKALMYSADLVELEEENVEPTRFEKFIVRLFGEKLQEVLVYFSVIVALALGIGIFVLLPNLLAALLHFNKETASGVIYYNLFEGMIRIVLFVTYIALISKMKDIQRVFEYHGAEHKTIHCYENEQELVVENVRRFSTRHPRCGTAFLFVVMIISILVFSFVGWHNIWINILARLILIPLVAGISYEIIKFAGRCDHPLMKLVSAPGLALQRFTTREPDNSQIEVAIEALKSVLVKDEGADKW